MFDCRENTAINELFTRSNNSWSNLYVVWQMLSAFCHFVAIAKVLLYSYSTVCAGIVVLLMEQWYGPFT